MSRLLTASAVVLLAAAALPAHEIKALASRLALEEAGGKTTIYLSWGHRLPVDDLVDAATIERYDLVSPAGKPAALKKSGTSLQANSAVLKEAGTYQVLVARKPSVFTYVLDADGLRQMRRGPKSAVTEGKIDSANRSVQCAKALIVVGPAPKVAPRAAGQAIEIVPLDAPSKWVSQADLRFQVLLDGKPLPGAQVTARYLGFKPDDAWCYATTSGRKGELTVRPSRPGTWVLKVRTQRPAPAKLRDQYDTESFTGTLTLEIAP